MFRLAGASGDLGPSVLSFFNVVGVDGGMPTSNGIASALTVPPGSLGSAGRLRGMMDSPCSGLMMLERVAFLAWLAGFTGGCPNLASSWLRRLGRAHLDAPNTANWETFININKDVAPINQQDLQ